MLAEKDARKIAEEAWGSGGTTLYSTDRDGAYEYACSAHGGYVIAAEALTAAEREALAPFTLPERRNGTDVYLFEEDCAWCLVALKTDIRPADPRRAGVFGKGADKTFAMYFSDEARAKEARVAALRRDQPGDVVKSALMSDGPDGKSVPGLTTVFTYDGTRHFVGDYKSCRDADGEPRLSKCRVLHSDREASIYGRAPADVVETWRILQKADAVLQTVAPSLDADDEPRGAKAIALAINIIDFAQAYAGLPADRQQSVRRDLDDLVLDGCEADAASALNQKVDTSADHADQVYDAAGARAAQINNLGAPHQAAWLLARGVEIETLMKLLQEPIPIAALDI